MLATSLLCWLLLLAGILAVGETKRGSNAAESGSNLLSMMDFEVSYGDGPPGQQNDKDELSVQSVAGALPCCTAQSAGDALGLLFCCLWLHRVWGAWAAVLMCSGTWAVSVWGQRCRVWALLLHSGQQAVAP
jgi:hypothetical protein